MLVAIFFVLSWAAGAQQPRATAFDQAYEEVLAAQKVLQEAEAARDQGAESRPAELQSRVNEARLRFVQALARWNSLC